MNKGTAASAAEQVRAALGRVDADEERVRAWTYLDRRKATDQAAMIDAAAARDGKRGALHGVPVGVKDIFDTADMPTENGTVLDAGRQPERDAEAVRRLRQAGAVILGKTVSTELAVYAPGKNHQPA